MKKAQLLISKLCLPRVICNHLFGEKHTLAHRLLVGAIIMLIGILITKHFEHSSEMTSIIADLSGNSLHAIGITPIIDELAKNATE